MRCKAYFPPVSCKIALVGEAPGEEEDKTGECFVGKSGQELTRMCNIAGIPRFECLTTNVFMDRPPGNKLDYWCAKKREMPPGYALAPLATGKYVRPEKLFELERLRQELLEFQPNVIVPLGATALWAVCGYPQIGKFRGAVQMSKLIPGVKVIPTWHPANVIRKWENRTIAILDLMKAKREAEYPEVRVMRREVWMEPTLEDLRAFKSRYLDGSPLHSIDIETARYQFITCIGFAPTEDRCLVVPFVDRRKDGYCYWPTIQAEAEAWRFVFDVLASEAEILGQNFLYDLWYLVQAGAVPRGYCHDTMIKHHAYEPELPKDLGFMGSILADETVWKQQRPKRRKATVKRED